MNAHILIAYTVVINFAAFLIFAADKYRAKKQLSRIAEWKLWFWVIVGGSVGAWSSMYMFRHKTKHLSFVIGVPIVFILQIFLFAWVMSIM